MAEAVAVIGLLSSIIQLVDFSSNLLDRLHDFVTTTKEVPDVFRNICVQLPLTTATLQRLSRRISENGLSSDEQKALQAIVDRTMELIHNINEVLSKTIPSKTSSSFEKRVLALQSLRYDKRIQTASAQLLQNVNLLTFFQTTQIHDNSTRSARRLSGTTFIDVPEVLDFQHGLNLGGAPHLAEGNFVGRELELKQLSNMLKPDSQRQSIVAVVGMGGMGKTQLCIEYAVTHQDLYSSIFWLNAQDESSLRADLLSVANIVLSAQESKLRSKTDEDDIIRELRQWLSQPKNRNWLLILDNLDNPKMPTDNDPSALDVREYFPYRSQGSILITTRARTLHFAKQLPLRKLETLEQGLEMLSVRSGRLITTDDDAKELVRRLDGLPLALTSAASFLERTTCTIQEYLKEYKENWVKNEAESLFEYGDRTLFTTWNMSVEKLKNQDDPAVELLRISAYFSNENIYYELLSGGDPNVWPILGDIRQNKATFDRSMAKLRDYSLIETTHRGYRLHPCVHDWTLSSLNQTIVDADVWGAAKCTVAASGFSIWATDYDQALSRHASHVIRLTHPLLYDVLIHGELNEDRCDALTGLGQILHDVGRIQEAMPLMTRALLWSQEHLGEAHETFLYACSMVGLFQKDLGNFAEAEDLIKIATYGRARTLGPYHTSTLDPVHNLGILYLDLDQFQEAEQMYLWSLTGCEQSYGPQDVNTFWAMMALAECYMAQDKLDEAARQFERALEGFDMSIDNDHAFSRRTASKLGMIYEQKGAYTSAAAMYQRVHESCRQLFGQDHWSTLEAKDDLDRLQSKCLSIASAASPPGLNESPPTPPTDDAAVASLQSSDEDVDDEGSPEGAHDAGEPFGIPFRPSKSFPLSCHRCRVPLTAETKRFICCFCDDHELCGDCHTQLRSKQQSDPDQEKQHDRHIFLSCDFPEPAP
ncbi:hypothetical protein LTR84_002804 [Exophiala bonariae]|uniref:NB-ARC domain-containing protein n=1 Tax=Exophiala bonariae TaxID=1690606 RepID=A0AAV9N8X9_9EURO|nr:hypothetical protein LTR84_002804 [Exophiala bonariae]